MSNFYALVLVLVSVWALVGVAFVVVVARSSLDLDRLDRAARVWRSLGRPRIILVRRDKRVDGDPPRVRQE